MAFSARGPASSGSHATDLVLRRLILFFQVACHLGSSVQSSGTAMPFDRLTQGVFLVASQAQWCSCLSIALKGAWISSTGNPTSEQFSVVEMVVSWGAGQGTSDFSGSSHRW